MIRPAIYYEEMKALAREVRAKYGLHGPRILKSDINRIYRDQGIRVDPWPHKLKVLRGAYFNDDLGPSVMIAKGLPDEPKIFTLAHELKHHLKDRDLGIAYCAPSNGFRVIEIGAEVFAAELIFPEQDFIDILYQMNIGRGDCTPEALVRLKRKTETTMSYAALAKRAEFLGYALGGSLQGVQYRKLEEHLFGEPLYKQILRKRRRGLLRQ